MAAVLTEHVLEKLEKKQGGWWEGGKKYASLGSLSLGCFISCYATSHSERERMKGTGASEILLFCKFLSSGISLSAGGNA